MLVVWLVFGLVFSLVFGLVGGLIFGMIFGFVLAFAFGAGECIRHGFLRLFLWRYNYAPLDYVRFSEHAKDLLFLRRVGDWYIFVHRLLMEHFAGMERRKGRGSGG
jgi:hypothetical protein